MFLIQIAKQRIPFDPTFSWFSFANTQTHAHPQTQRSNKTTWITHVTYTLAFCEQKFNETLVGLSHCVLRIVCVYAVCLLRALYIPLCVFLEYSTGFNLIFSLFSHWHLKKFADCSISANFVSIKVSNQIHSASFFRHVYAYSICSRDLHFQKKA